MKKVFVSFVLVLVVLNLCFAQSSNVTQTIVGTWIDSEGRIWVFSADGKLTYGSHTIDGGVEFHYYATDTKLTIEMKDDEIFYYWPGVVQTYDISISSDGKTLILMGGKNVFGWSIAGPGWSENQLIRQ